MRNPRRYNENCCANKQHRSTAREKFARSVTQETHCNEYGAVYHVPEKNCFYIQSDPTGSSTMTYFGPFEGDPTKLLKLETKPPPPHLK